MKEIIAYYWNYFLLWLASKGIISVETINKLKCTPQDKDKDALGAEKE